MFHDRDHWQQRVYATLGVEPTDYERARGKQLGAARSRARERQRTPQAGRQRAANERLAATLATQQKRASTDADMVAYDPERIVTDSSVLAAIAGDATKSKKRRSRVQMQAAWSAGSFSGLKQCARCKRILQQNTNLAAHQRTKSCKPVP